ncbi:MAG: homoserine kinase [Hyphomicrobiaceae bacterium]|nr:MAG: homoserine kinase [Hyphomicrobiaceae bacterium]
MAVYTEVPDEALAAFLAGYDLGKLTSCKGIAEGVENSNFLVGTERGRFILTLYEKRVAKADLPFFLGLMEHLSANGLSCPLPVRDRRGRMLGDLCGRPAAIITFLDGVSVKRPSVVQCESVGGAMARMHLAGKGFRLKRKNALSVKGWRPLFKSFEADADAISTGLRDEIADELTYLEKSWPTGLPEGVIHADLFPDNVFFLDGRVSGLIDFYFACNDLLAYDLSIMLNAWCFEPGNSFNVTKARALLKGYARERPISVAEMDALPTLARGSALRFLLTRAYDWIHTPKDALVRPKDPLEYLLKLRFHRRISSAREYGLEAAG